MAPNGSPPPPPRWSAPFDHDRFDPFVDLALEEPEQLGRDLRRGLEHWRAYVGCSDGKHRRGRCHHRRHLELLARYRGQGRGRRGKGGDHLVELHHKRTESAEHHSRFAQWLILHMDRRSRSVGYFDAAGEFCPYTLKQIADDLRRPGEERLRLDVLEDVINAFLAAKLIHRWQGRERICLECGTELPEKGARCARCGSDAFRYRGKVGILQVTHEFLIRSGMAQLRDERLARDEKRRKAAEQRQAVDEHRAVIFGMGEQSRQLENRREHIRRAVVGTHPHWLQEGNAGRWKIDQEVDRQLEELAQRTREAAQRRRPPDRP